MVIKMKLRYNRKEITLIECTSFFSRLKGFMFCKKIDRALLFNKCNSIHTFFMYNNIDVIMCNNDNIVLYYYNNFKKNKIILPKKGVSKVFETPSSFFNVVVGNKMEVLK